MYGIHVANHGFVRSAEIGRQLSDLFSCDHPQHMERMKHLFAIEALEARGARYANHDFDVLSAAISFLHDNQQNS